MSTPYDDLINAAREHAAERVENIKQDRHGFYTTEDLADAEKAREDIEAQASKLEALHAPTLASASYRQDPLKFRVCVNCGKARFYHRWSDENRELMCQTKKGTRP